MSFKTLGKVARGEVPYPRGWGALDVGTSRLRDTGWAYRALGRQRARGCKERCRACKRRHQLHSILYEILMVVVQGMPARTQWCCRKGSCRKPTCILKGFAATQQQQSLHLDITHDGHRQQKPHWETHLHQGLGTHLIKASLFAASWRNCNAVCAASKKTLQELS